MNLANVIPEILSYCAAVSTKMADSEVQALKELRLGEGCIGPHHHILALLLLPLDLRQKHLVLVRGAVDVPWAQLHCQAVALSIE